MTTENGWQMQTDEMIVVDTTPEGVPGSLVLRKPHWTFG